MRTVVAGSDLRRSAMLRTLMSTNSRGLSRTGRMTSWRLRLRRPSIFDKLTLSATVSFAGLGLGMEGRASAKRGNLSSGALGLRERVGAVHGDGVANVSRRIIEVLTGKSSS